jgi:hypothetical protein
VRITKDIEKFYERREKLGVNKRKRERERERQPKPVRLRLKTFIYIESVTF